MSEVGWTSTATAVRATLDVMELSNGRIPVPANLTGTMIEIGCNGHNLAWDTPFGVKGIDGIEQHLPISQQLHVFLISFEPLLDKYAVLLARGTQRFFQDTKDMAVPLRQCREAKQQHLKAPLLRLRQVPGISALLCCCVVAARLTC